MALSPVEAAGRDERLTSLSLNPPGSNDNLPRDLVEHPAPSSSDGRRT